MAGPNLVLLNNALAQTGWTKAPLSETSWVAAVRTRLRSVKWQALAKDVGPFLESAEDRALLTRDTVTRLLGQREHEQEMVNARQDMLNPQDGVGADDLERVGRGFDLE